MHRGVGEQGERGSREQGEQGERGEQGEQGIGGAGGAGGEDEAAVRASSLANSQHSTFNSQYPLK